MTFYQVSPQECQAIRYEMDRIMNQISHGEESKFCPKHVLRALQLLGQTLPDDGSKYAIIVDYDQSLEAMLAACHFDWQNVEITKEHFPITNQGQVNAEAILSHFDQLMLPSKALEKLDQLDLRPGTLPELLAFGQKYPDIRRRCPVIAVGSIWQATDELSFIPYMSGNPSVQGLGLSFFNDPCAAVCRWLAFPKAA